MARKNETEEEKTERKAAKKAVKEAKRLQRQGLGDPGQGQKPCSLCQRPRDLLIRSVQTHGAFFHAAMYGENICLL